MRWVGKDRCSRSAHGKISRWEVNATGMASAASVYHVDPLRKFS